MPARGHRTDVNKTRGTRAERINTRLQRMIENCIFINYAQDQRDITGRICGDPMPGHREYRERLEQWKGEINTRENSEDS